MTEISEPSLLVHIQSVDIQTLDFQCGASGTVKNRHATYVEATKSYLVVGSTSGSVYLFNRETLEFEFVIPCKGGKVCLVSISPDESHIVVASVRGKISIFRLRPGDGTKSSTNVFSHVIAVHHHVNNEVTEMHWSPNGKYLFIGDTAGLVSLVDIGSLQEFPRPYPSKLILRTESRVLQIDCVFPYLAVCSLSSIILCDLEKEDFTRVTPKATSTHNRVALRPCGICFIITPKQELILVVCYAGNENIFLCNMEGAITQLITIQNSNSPGCLGSIPLFNPKDDTGEPGLDDNTVSPMPPFSPGKLYCSDDKTIVSVTSDVISIIDATTFTLQLVTEHFHRINSTTLLSNYLFVWSGWRLDTVALAHFRSYGQHLLKAKLTDLLNRWIRYTINVLCRAGIETDTEFSDSRDTVVSAVWKTMLAPDCDKEFIQFVQKCDFLPGSFQFALQNDLEHKETVDEVWSSKIQLAAEILVERLEMCKNSVQDIDPCISDIFEALYEFYVGIDEKTFNSGEDFETISIHGVVEELNEISKMQKSFCISEKTETRLHEILDLVFIQISEKVDFKFYERNSLFWRLASFARSSDWFQFLEMSENEIRKDCLIAEMAALVIPLVGYDTWCKLSRCDQPGFFHWLVQVKLGHLENVQSLVTKSLTSIGNNNLNLIRFFKEVLFTRTPQHDTTLQHLTTCLALEAEDHRNVTSALLSSVTLTWSTEEMRRRFLSYCNRNKYLMLIVEKTILNKSSDGSSDCSCGISTKMGFSMKSNLENSKSSNQDFQFERDIFTLLQKKYKTEIVANGTFLKSHIYIFAMRRNLVFDYVENGNHWFKLLPDAVQLEIIWRSGLHPNLIHHVPFNVTNVKILMTKIPNSNSNSTQCSVCGQSLTAHGDFPHVTYDSIGMWMLSNCDSVSTLMELVSQVGLNERSTFSLKFYQAALQKERKREQITHLLYA